MPKYKLEILVPALYDIEYIAEYHLLMVGPRSAEGITDRLLDTMIILEDHPYAGAQHPDPVLSRQGYRKLLYGDYVCVYRVIGEVVVVYRVVHGMTDYPELFK